MDGRGRWMDNVFIERLWRSLKYECVFLNAFETGSEARAGIGRWIGYYNADRPHSRSAAGRPTRSMLSKASGETGGVIQPEIHLSQAASFWANPEHRDHSLLYAKIKMQRSTRGL